VVRLRTFSETSLPVFYIVDTGRTKMSLLLAPYSSPPRMLVLKTNWLIRCRQTTHCSNHFILRCCPKIDHTNTKPVPCITLSGLTRVESRCHAATQFCGCKSFPFCTACRQHSAIVARMWPEHEKGEHAQLPNRATHMH
jgi:hypothetical protein